MANKNNQGNLKNDNAANVGKIAHIGNNICGDKGVTSHTPTPEKNPGSILDSMIKKKHEYMMPYMGKTLGEIYSELGIPKDLLSTADLKDIYMGLTAGFLDMLYKSPEFLDYEIINHFRNSKEDVFCLESLGKSGRKSKWYAFIINQSEGMGVGVAYCNKKDENLCSPFVGQKMSDFLKYLTIIN